MRYNVCTVQRVTPYITEHLYCISEEMSNFYETKYARCHTNENRAILMKEMDSHNDTEQQSMLISFCILQHFNL